MLHPTTAAAAAITAAAATTTTAAATAQKYSIFGRKNRPWKVISNCHPKPPPHPKFSIILVINNPNQPCGVHHCMAHAY